MVTFTTNAFIYFQEEKKRFSEMQPQWEFVTCKLVLIFNKQKHNKNNVNMINIEAEFNVATKFEQNLLFIIKKSLVHGGTKAKKE